MSPRWRARSSEWRATWPSARSPPTSRRRWRRARHVTDLTLSELAAAIAARKISALEATDACLERIARLDGRLRAFITLDAEGARARARALDVELAAGSIRLPAACCGIVGLKPTYGRVSRAGAMPLSWSLDHLGPMTRSVRDAALMLEIIAGHDPHDATSSAHAVGTPAATLDLPVRDVRLGLPENYYFDGVTPE